MASNILYNPYGPDITTGSNPYTLPQMQIPQIPYGATPHQLDKVNGLESAKAFKTLPNSTYALFDANEDVMYIKQTDASNFPTIRRFRFVEEAEPAPPQQVQYVTMEEFNKFKEEVLNAQQSIRSAADAASSKPIPATYE